MIRYALKCENDHGFESWFQSADAFDKLQAAGMVACPECGTASVSKALMAPPVRPSRKAAGAAQPAAAPTPHPQGGHVPVAAGPHAPRLTPEQRAEALKALRRQIEANSEYVGTSFAREARKMHLGEAPERSIYGEASLRDAKELLEDGIPVAPLPFLPTRKTN
ncbi:hypothetical protein PSA7680_03031 [Pseudoruegeria aquimaris]|uniref:DUF1178 family protein n=1 Tax=Pseudoruegeria aquimaris TaxID=393663 RepID=A0A1Y5T8D6_9RHOB|nr:DUF1178 family protein [Pseudoruegeria aquimaris]SLN57720.1 hypothetical protein PSA7680_03031 [Pseudoruegeria aquimaris]